MSVGVIVMNKRGVAIAADSAATLEREEGQDYRVLPSANKIHRLSDVIPVAVVHAGNSEFMGFPWELVFLNFRNKRGKDAFPSLEECSKAFMDFLRTNQHLSNDARQHDFASRIIDAKLRQFQSELSTRISDTRRDYRHSQQTWDDEQEKEFTADYIRKERDRCTSESCDPSLPTLYPERCKERYFDLFKERRKEICWPKAKHAFEEADFDAMNDDVWEIVFPSFSLVPSGKSKAISEITFVGYGMTEEFPCLEEHLVDGIVNGNLRHRLVRKVPVEFGDDARIEAIGQPEVIQRFLYGYDPKTLGAFTKKLIQRIYPTIGQEILDNIEDLDSIRRQELLKMFENPTDEQISRILGISDGSSSEDVEIAMDVMVDYTKDPILALIAHFALPELGEVAEKLAGLTSLRQELEMDRPTVQGPIDVAVISKHKGFSWLKRKE